MHFGHRSEKNQPDDQQLDLELDGHRRPNSGLPALMKHPFIYSSQPANGWY
jgi:hypothetical protein